MLPDFLSNSYVQYKEDTNNFITWLVDTAKKYGYVRPPSIPTSTDAVPRLKGRARTDAKKAASISTSTDATPPLKGKANTDEKKAASMPKRKKMEVSVQDIVSLAKTIVANTSRKNPVVVPQYVLKWARSAVDARRQFVTWFQTQAFNQPALQDDNERYTYFVQVLEDALDILAPHVTASPKENALPTRSDPSKQVEAPGQTLRNMFENLEMDEPQEIDLLDAAVVDVHDVVAVEDSIETQLKELCELESSEAEMRFAIFCTLQDAHRVKDFIIKTWKNYISGEIDLVTASVTTNTAISFVHGAEEQLMASYPQFAGYPELLRAFYPLAMQTVARMADASDRSAEEINARTTQFELRHVQDVSMATDHGSTHMDVASDPQHDFDEVEFLFARPCRLLEVFCDWFWFSPSGFRTRRAAAADGVVPPADLSKMSPEQKEDDWYILADVLPEIMLLTDLVIPAEDEFSQGMRQVLLGDSIPLWVVFAHQVYLEIHRTLREQVGRGLVELRVAKTQVKASLKDYFENEKSMLDDHQPEAGAQILHELDEILNKWVEEDAFTKGKEREYIGCLDRPYLLLSQHPLLCGTLLQYVRLRLQDASIAMVNGWGSILCGAHLYNAARQEGYLSTGWVDMEAFIAMHSPELIFVGKVPSSVDEYCKQLCFAQGMSITFYSHGPQRSKSISKKGPRHIDAESHVSRLLNNVHHSTTKAEFDAEAVSKMFTNVFEKNKRSAALNSLLTQWNKTHKLTNVQLLAIVRQTMANEQPMLHFDYIAMHHRCRQLFIKVRSDLDAELVCPKTEDHDTYEGSLSGLLTEILYLAGQKGNAGPLVKASGILKDVVEREGDAEMKKMRLKGKRHGWLAKGI